MSQIVLCGRGGQGVVFLTRLIGDIATSKGLNVISAETHGMAVRGGSINSCVKIGDYQSSLVRWGKADFLISLDEKETQNNRHFLRDNGVILENSVKEPQEGILRIDATGMARNLGMVQLENVVTLGFASMITGFPLSPKEIKEGLMLDKRENVRDMNVKALELGMDAASPGKS
ncbi:MAG: 2-oxoacid:acceptor oxidoreductase family protein [Syntrophaceae bacterium]|nr:2-oxoacid:acceptor oxidoreductase family protein [Syntrophaceae bacterium]